MFAAPAMIAVTPALASLFVAYDLPMQVEQSGLIITATAGGSRVELRDKVPYTYTDLVVESCLKGDHAPGDTVTLRQRGGDVGQWSLWAQGDPKLEKGGRYVLFLLPSQGQFVLSGMAQGLARITVKDRVAYAENPLVISRYLPREGRVTQGRVLAPTPLADYLAEVARLVALGARGESK